jgi:hypothetical protein
MYYTGVDPRTMLPVYVPKNPHEKAMQRALIQYRNPKNYDLVLEALTLAGREDLIGFSKECLVKPDMRIGSDYMKQSSSKGASGKKAPSSPKAKGNTAKSQGKATKSKEKPTKNSSFSKKENSGKNRHSPKQNPKKGRK